MEHRLSSTESFINLFCCCCERVIWKICFYVMIGYDDDDDDYYYYYYYNYGPHWIILSISQYLGVHFWNRAHTHAGARAHIHSCFIAIYNGQDFVIWTETGDHNGIHAGLKHTGEKIRGIVHPGVGTANDVITFDLSTQPLANGMLYWEGEQVSEWVSESISQSVSQLVSQWANLRSNDSLRCLIGHSVS